MPTGASNSAPLLHRVGPDEFVTIGGLDETFQSYPLAPLHARLLREQSPVSVTFYMWVYLATLCAAFCASKAAAAAAGVCCVGPAMHLRLDPPVMRCAPGLSSCLPGIRLRFGPGVIMPTRGMRTTTRARSKPRRPPTLRLPPPIRRCR